MPVILHEIDHSRFSFISEREQENSISVACQNEREVENTNIKLPKLGTILLPLACSARHRDFAIFAAPEEEMKTLYTSVSEVKVKEFKLEDNGLRLGTEKRIESIERKLDEAEDNMEGSQRDTNDLILKQQEGLEALSDLIDERSGWALISGATAALVLALTIAISTICLWRTIHYYHD